MDFAKDLQLTIREINSHYRTGNSDLASDFFGPCLAACTLYRRATGYFSSSALATWLAGVERLSAGAEIEIRVIASPELSAHDIETLRSTLDGKQREEIETFIVARLIDEIASVAGEASKVGLYAKLFAWLVVHDFLKIRFAFPEHIEQAGIFHEKIGIFDFPNGDLVAFTGSANETYGGHVKNYESVDVYRSWKPGELERVNTKEEQFDEAWHNQSAGLKVRELSHDTIARLKAVAPFDRPQLPTSAPPPNETPKSIEDGQWQHQQEAIDRFLEEKAGILEMATGTGKTRTALRILRRLVEEGKITGAIVAVEGTDLLDQWATQLDAFVQSWQIPFLIHRNFGAHHELGDFALDPKNAILVISRNQLPRLFQETAGSKSRENGHRPRRGPWSGNPWTSGVTSW